MITTAEAAERLCVTPRRVRQLLEAGALSGQKFGRDWMVVTQTVDEYVRTHSGPQRTRRGESGRDDE